MVGYDADCRCATNYLGAIERHFEQHPQSPGCSICFEHPLSGMLSAQIYQAVTAYELHLRYYVQALRFSGFPHADFTIGSCMAVRAEAYRGQGGMNKRKAGEDFYFLHKIIPLGGFTALTGTTVYPSPRPSDRVPFGTGKAVRDILSGREIKTYPLEAFLDLKRLVDCVPRMYQRERPAEPLGLEELPASMRAFLTEQQFTAALTEICRNVSSEAAFCKRFFQWFDGIRARKFVHHARDRFYGEGGLREQAGRLLGAMNCLQTGDSNLALGEMLQIYRNCDRMPGLRTSWAQCAPDPRIAR